MQNVLIRAYSSKKQHRKGISMNPQNPYQQCFNNSQQTLTRIMNQNHQAIGAQQNSLAHVTPSIASKDTFHAFSKKTSLSPNRFFRASRNQKLHKNKTPLIDTKSITRNSNLMISSKNSQYFLGRNLASTVAFGQREVAQEMFD